MSVILQLSELAPFAARPLPALVEAWGRGFIIRVSELTPPPGPMRTVTSDAGSGPITMELATFVMPLRRRPEATMPFISIGRLDGNDVVFADVTVSKFHAFAREVEGSFQLQDANSHNGTWVNEGRVPPQKAGPPTTLRSGDALRFGSVSSTFIDAASLHTLLQRLPRLG